jgi:hypothetical protein
MISDRVQRRELDDLLEQVDRALDLRGDRADLQKLAQQLRDRKEKRRQQRDAAFQQLRDREEKQRQQRDMAFRQAEELLSAGDAKGGLSAIRSVNLKDPSDVSLERRLKELVAAVDAEDGDLCQDSRAIDPKDLRPSHFLLERRLEELVAAEDSLSDLVQRCKADGLYESDEVIEMYLAAAGYLKQNPRHEKIGAMQDQLLSRMLKPNCLSKASEVHLSKLPQDLLIQLPPAILSQLPAFKNSVGMSFRLLPYGPGGAISIGVYEVTQQQYEAVMGSNPSQFKGASNPVENVSWDDAVAYCAKLSSLPAEVAAGHMYRLPTEAEWEYACRAGTTTDYICGNDKKDLGKYAWFDENSGKTTHAVGEKLPNAWGLYDMHGNVWELCLNAESSGGVYRGGSWGDSAWNSRSANRCNFSPLLHDNGLGFRLAQNRLGFRLALSPSGKADAQKAGKKAAKTIILFD